MSLLSQEQIDKHLAKLDVEWSVIAGEHLERVYNFDNFTDGLKFVNKVGKIAEEHNHHPDVHLSWGKVVVVITTHDQSGLTKKDFDLASAL